MENVIRDVQVPLAPMFVTCAGLGSVRIIEGESRFDDSDVGRSKVFKVKAAAIYSSKSSYIGPCLRLQIGFIERE